MNSTLGQGVTVSELMTKKQKLQNLFITSCAVVVDDKMIFVGATHDECLDRARALYPIFVTWKSGYLATDGKFYDSSEAGMIAYRNRQTVTLCSPLQPADIF